MTIAPDPKFPERPGNIYDRKMSPATPGQRGPLRFEEGVATDTDVPNEFSTGASQGYMAAPGRPNRNAPVHTKTADETMRERAHVGSAAWVEAGNTITEFSHGAFSKSAEVAFEEVARNGSHQQRLNPAVVND
jgi:hypothetical protein